ncbi:MAG: helical backbone metal receptor [Lentisphaeria bacterium]
MTQTGQQTGRAWRPLAALLLAALAGGCSPRPPAADSAPAPAAAPDCRRIISCAPSITETLFALGAGRRVVGVSRFCAYPPEVRTLPKIGGYLDPNYEMILRLQPDLVLSLRENSSLTEFLTRNHIRHEVMDNDSVAAIAAATERLGTLCGATKPAAALAGGLRREFAAGQRPGAAESAPRVLFCIGRDSPGSGGITRAYLAGPRTIYQEVITAAGGRNVLEAAAGAAYPMVSGESILRLNPDLIIEIQATSTPEMAARSAADWQSLPGVAAVKNGRVHLISADYAAIPGPRLGLLLADVRRLIAAPRANGTVAEKREDHGNQ